MDGNSTLCITNGSVTGAKIAIWLVMAIICTTIIIFTTVVLSVVVAAKAVRGTIRFVLANILLASTTTVAGFILILLREVFLLINPHLFSRTDVSFQILLAIMAMGENGRSAFMAVFAVVVVVIIKCSSSAVKFKYLAITVVAVWIACVAVGMILVVPDVIELSPCSTGLTFQPGEKLWLFGTSYFLFFVVIPFTLAIFMPVYALCYIRSNLVSENASSLKPMVKFTLFLLLGNVLGYFGNSVATAGSLIIREAHVGYEVARVFWRLYHVVLALSLIPTPILIIAYFKPVRTQMRKCVLRVCGKCCKRRLRRSKQDPLTEMMLASPADNEL